MRIDLHCHTTASDGVLEPAALVALAAEREVDVIAVTDHDTVGGVAEATQAGAARGVRVVPGIELSTVSGDRGVHVLGLFVEARSPDLVDTLERLRVQREERVERMVTRLRDLGYELTVADVRAQAKGAILARPHVARALVAKGAIASVSAAFTPELIADGGRADVPRPKFSSVDAIELVRSAGGVAVIAHPGMVHHLGMHDPVDEALIAELAAAGLTGLEVDHPDHPPAVRDRLAGLCDRLGLVPTGGTDFHGEWGHPPGTCITTPESFARLEAATGGARSATPSV